MIVKANNINGNNLITVVMNFFDTEFNLIKTVQSNEINISKNYGKFKIPLSQKKISQQKMLIQFF